MRIKIPHEYMQFDHPLSEQMLCAVQTALNAGQLLQQGFRSHFDVSFKPGSHNLVTEYDRLSEEYIIKELLNAFPDHTVLAEESGLSAKSKGQILWIIDPLDGTVNFAHRIPIFSISIAAVAGNEIIGGVVYQPMTQELFVAEKGQGAYLNGKPLSVSLNRHRKNAFLATGFPYNVHENPLHCVDVAAKIIKEGIPVRRLGSAALDLAYTACGAFDAYWEVSLNPWDIAAGQLLVEEAGGVVTDYLNRPRDLFSTGPVLASNGLIHEEMIQTLTSYS